MYFETSLDNDINFLIDNMGVDIKINNQEAKALLKNIDNVTDDKQIITSSEINRGDYVEYVDAFFIALNETVDKRYNLYYKNIIQKCNHDIKFVINEKVYLFYVIVEGGKFGIQIDTFIQLPSDNITVTLPITDATRKIKRDDRFVKFGSAWKVKGIDYTKAGIITLFCEVDSINTNTDDLENEIAGGKHLQDIIPILPFDIDESGDDSEPNEPEGDYRIELNLSYDEVIFNTFETCNVKVYLDDEEIDDDIVFEIIGDDTILWLENIQDRQCNIKAGNKAGKVILRVSLADNEDVYEEIEVSAVAW